MLSNNLRGHLSLLLVLAIAVSLFPVSAQASEEAVPAETAMEVIPETTVPTEDILQEEPSALPMLQQKMDDILVKYLGVTVLTEEEIIDIVNTMYWDDMEAALAECDALEPMISALSEDELTQIEATYEGTATIVCFYETMQLAMTPGFFAASGTHTPITGVTVTVSGATDNSMANGAVTVTAKGSGGLWGLGASAKTATITVKNSTADKATISFNWTATSVNQLKIDGTVVGGTSGSFAKLLDSEGEFTITVTTAKNSTTNKLVMSNFDWQKAANSSNITFVYDSTLGSITVDGTETSSGTTKKISVDGTALTAKAGSGVTFLGWIDDADGRILATAADSTLQPASDMTIRAVFAKTSPWFQVDSTYLIEGLTEATAKGSMIVLMNNATLPSGNYTIDSGKTLLIPYNSTLSCVKADPVTADTTFVIPTAYRTLTMADGAHITIKGEMSLSGVLNSVQGTNSSTHGPTSFVKMSSGSSITVKEKASLYVWGYITGVTDSSGNFSEGTVTVERDGTVYEPFQAADWRGGTASLNMVNNNARVFPISQYYVQNVEVPMTLNAGAIEQGSLIVDISLAGVVKPQVPFIGKGSNMFCIEKGSITKDYAENSDRLIVDINGDLSVSNITVDLVNVLSYQIALESKKYVLPVTCNMSININSGSTVTIKQDLSLLPGSVLNIKNNGKLIVNSGSNVFAYDRDDWIGNKYVFSLADFRILKHAPGRKKTRTDDDLVDASVIIEGEVSVNAGFGYTSANGAAISGIEGGKITVALGTQTSTYQATQNNTSVSYQPIKVTPLQLLNANGEYFETAEKGAGTYTYINGFWHKGTSCDGGTATCTKKAVCSTCGLQYGDFGDHSFEQGICSVCGQYMRVEITATNIAVNDGLDMWFYVRANNVNAASYKAVVTKHFADDRSPNPIVVTIPSGQWERYIEESTGIEYLRFCFSDISAKEMTDSVEAAIFHTDGTQVSNNYSQTVQNYAITTLKNYKDNISVKAEALKHALVDMLEYGASAQTQFAYNTAVPANVHAELSDFSGYLTTATPNCTNQKNYGNNVAGVTVSATNTLMFTFYFKVADPDGMYAIIEYTPSGETVEKTVRVESKDFYERIAGSLYGVDVKELSIVDGRALMTCTLYNSDGTVVTTATDSIEGYAYRNAGKGKIFMDMMRFVDSAFTYFTAN